MHTHTHKNTYDYGETKRDLSFYNPLEMNTVNLWKHCDMNIRLTTVNNENKKTCMDVTYTYIYINMSLYTYISTYIWKDSYALNFVHHGGPLFPLYLLVISPREQKGRSGNRNLCKYPMSVNGDNPLEDCFWWNNSTLFQSIMIYRIGEPGHKPQFVLNGMIPSQGLVCGRRVLYQSS